MQRHLFLTIWLWLIIIGNGLMALGYLLEAPSIHNTMPAMSMNMIYLIGLIGIFNIVCAVALLKWKKWGFWGLLASAIVVCILNVVVAAASPLGAILSSFIGILILYWALNMGGPERKAWPRLK